MKSQLNGNDPDSEDFDFRPLAFMRSGCVWKSLGQSPVVNVEDSKDVHVKLWFTFWKDFCQRLVDNQQSKSKR